MLNAVHAARPTVRRIASRRHAAFAAALALWGANAASASVFEFNGSNFLPGAGAVVLPFAVSNSSAEFITGTYSAAGGFTPTGNFFPAGGIDALLRLFNTSSGTLIAQHDDLNGSTNRDAEIRTTGYTGPTRPGALITSALVPGQYELAMSRFSSGSDTWSFALANTVGTVSIRNPVFGGGQVVAGVLIGAGQMTLDSGTYTVKDRLKLNPGGSLILDGGVALSAPLLVDGVVFHNQASVTTLETNIAGTSGSTGNYYLQNALATLDTDVLHIGLGTNSRAFVHQSDGSVTVPNTVLLGNSFTTGEQAIYNLTGGTLRARAINADSSSSNMFNLNGGKLSLDLLNITALRLGSTLTWGSGTFEATTPFTQLDLYRIFGDAVSLTPARRLALNASANWNSLVKLDGGTLAVDRIDPAAPLQWNSGTIEFTGHANFGAGHGLGSLITLSSGKSITGASGAISSSGAILVQPGGRLAISSLTTAGNLILGGAGSLVDATQVVNTGNVSGSGLIRAVLSNETLGTISLASADGLRVDGIVTNAGRISLTGGSLTGSVVTNYAGGTISGRGTLAAGTFGNSGNASFSGGTSDLIANVTNQAGGKIIVTGAGTLTVHRALTNFAGSEFRVSQNSHAVFLGNVTGLGAFTGTGTKYFEGGTTGGSLMSGAGASVVEASGSLTTAGIRETSLVLRGPAALTSGSATSRVNTLGFEGGALDLGNNQLVIDYATASPAGEVRAAIINGDLFSSAAPTLRRAIGYLDNAALGIGSFGGLTVDASSVLVRWTLAGDTNLDGNVNFADLVNLARSYNRTDSAWINGDTNYDGTTNFADLVALAQNYNGSLALAAVESPSASFAADFALAQAMVPEPTQALTLLAAAGLIRRKRGG